MASVPAYMLQIFLLAPRTHLDELALALLRHQQHDQIAAKIGRGHRLVATMPSVQKHWAFESLATGDLVDPDMAQGQTGTKA